MNALGGLFPEEWRENLADENLKTGAVLRFAVPDTTPPKIKILIVIGIDGEKVALATVFVNSQVNPNVLNTSELQRLQYLLTTTNFPFLMHDSFVDCSSLKARDYNSVKQLIKNDPASHLGNLLPEDLTKLIELVKSARTIPVRLKKQFRLFI
jgi:hypothetical protein